MNTTINLNKIYNNATVYNGVTHFFASYMDVLKSGVYLHHSLIFVEIGSYTKALSVGEPYRDAGTGEQTGWKFKFTNQHKEENFLVLYF